MDEERSSGSLSVRVPNFHASGLSPWNGVVSYDASVRLCLSSWAKGSKEAKIFMNNECATLRDSFSLRHVLQSEEEIMSRRSSDLVSGAAAPKAKKTIGKIKVQVKKVKMALDSPTGCAFPQVARHIPKSSSLSSKSLAYVNVGAQYIKEIGVLLKSSLSSSQTTES